MDRLMEFHGAFELNTCLHILKNGPASFYHRPLSMLWRPGVHGISNLEPPDPNRRPLECEHQDYDDYRISGSVEFVLATRSYRQNRGIYESRGTAEDGREGGAR